MKVSIGSTKEVLTLDCKIQVIVDSNFAESLKDDAVALLERSIDSHVVRVVSADVVETEIIDGTISDHDCMKMLEKRK